MTEHRPRIRILLLFLVGAVVLSFGASIAETREIVLTKDGRAVVLDDDGTWHYALDVPPELKTGGDFDFRRAKWGMDMGLVRTSESTPVNSEDANLLTRRVTVAGFEAFAGYLFDEQDHLNGGTYLILLGNTDSSDQMGAYKTIHGWLELGFGRPEAERTLWSNTALKDDPDSWAEAHRSGHVEFDTVWRVGTTLISHVLGRPSESGFQHILAYSHQPALERLYRQ